jgi:hypothetical protein
VTTTFTSVPVVVTEGFPGKPLPVTVITTVRPTTALPFSLVMCIAGGGGGGVPRTVADVAEPPLRLVTLSDAAVVGAPKVHETVIEVVDTTVAALHVPSAVAATVAPTAKPVPVIVKEVVEFAGAVAGATDEIVGAG